MNSPPHVSVIVPVFNQSAGLIQCLDALGRQSCPNESYEVIVVDNGSRDEMARVREMYPGVKFAHEDKPGSYASRNCGARHARGKLFAFTDADCIPDETWIEHGSKALVDNPAVGIVGGRICLFAEDSNHLTAAELHQSVLAFRQESYVQGLRFALTCNLFTRRDLFEHTGGFEERLFSGGDAEWCQRVHSSGGEILYAEDVMVRHPARRSLRELMRQRRRTAGGRFDRARGIGHPPLPLNDPGFSYATPIRRVARHASHPLLRTRWNLVRFTMVELIMTAVATIEKTRLYFGGKSLRR